MKFLIVVWLDGQAPDTIIGPFDEVEEADRFLNEHDEAFANLEMDLAKKNPDLIAHTAVMTMNTPADLGW